MTSTKDASARDKWVTRVCVCDTNTNTKDAHTGAHKHTPWHKIVHAIWTLPTSGRGRNHPEMDGSIMDSARFVFTANSCLENLAEFLVKQVSLCSRQKIGEREKKREKK